MIEHQIAAVAEWLKTRPECIQKLASEFPFGWSTRNAKLGQVYLVGYSEPDVLILSTTDPAVDYDKANATKIYVHAEHFRQ